MDVIGGGKEFALKDLRGADLSSQALSSKDFTQCDAAGANFKVGGILVDVQCLADTIDRTILLCVVSVEVDPQRQSLLPRQPQRC